MSATTGPPSRLRGRRRRTLLTALAALGAGLWLSAGHAGAGRDDLPASLDPRFRAALRSPFAAARLLPPRADGMVAGFVQAESAPAAAGLAGRLESLGGRIGSRFGSRMTVRLPRERLIEAARLPGLRRFRAAQRLEPLLNLARPDIRADLVHQGLPDTGTGPMGDDVLVGVVDTGIDTRHADFRWPGGATRIAALWDQGDPIGPAPAPWGYGSRWSAADIDMELCRERDSTYFAHGTHVAGIAAGSGRATGNGKPPFTYVGVAPRARLAVVNTTFDDVDIADGIAWVFQEASLLGLPAVVNLSLGGSAGPHDGTSDLELAINAMSGPGRIVVASAGNSNGRGVHGERIVPVAGEGVLSFRIFGYTPVPGVGEGVLLNGWYEGGDDIMVTVRSPNGHLVGPVPKGGSASFDTPDGWVSIDQEGTEGFNNNGDVEVLVEVSDAGGEEVTTGDWEIRMTRVSAPSGGEVDFWIVDHAFPFPPAFVSGKEEAELVLMPATADSVIAVAAHTTRASWTSLNGSVYNFGQTLNQVCSFSCPGPRRDGVAKPDLSAPGSAIGSAHSTTALPNPTAYILPDSVHKVLQGTSMSAPHVTGTVALLLSRWPALSAAQVREALRATARTDGFTGAVPNINWGWGKLDLERLFAARLAFAAAADPARLATPGSSISLVGLCGVPAPGSWSTPYRVRVTDSAGWLHHAVDGPPLPTAAYEAVLPEVGPGQQACAPAGGALTIEVPPGAANGQSTMVTFDIEPDGLPWMRQTLVTSVTVSFLAGVEPGPAPDRLALTLAPGDDGRPRELRLALPRTGPVTLQLFDVLGRRQAVLLDGVHPAGEVRLPWPVQNESGRPLAGGIYFLRADDGVERIGGRIVLAR